MTNYGYDVWNRMTSADNATYAYNAQGLRVSKSVGTTTTNFLLVGGNVWSDGTTNYTRGIELISNGTQLYLYNVRGDVIQLLGFDGVVDKTYDYDAYGNEYARDLGDSNPFRYCGEYYDTETGFIYLRARYYDPMVGRFTSVDPIKDGLNWYSYCYNNPVNYVDLNGEKPFSIFSSPLEKAKDFIKSVLGIAAAYVLIVYGEDIQKIVEAGPEAHYARNELNVNESNVDWSGYDSFIEYIEQNYNEQGYFQNLCHMDTGGKQGLEAKKNIKYLSTDGHYEVIICYPENGTPYVVDESVDPLNMGTYNYVGAIDDMEMLETADYIFDHLIYDMLPYYLYGNTADDSFGILKKEILDMDLDSVEAYNYYKLLGLVG